jgi:tRNA threonylcarbamoyladenosine biosynthesis protein TsaB
MKILALETATEYCSVALLLDGEVTELFEHRPREQTARVLPMVDEILAGAGLVPRQLDALAFGQGPGAFTGVRIAASVVQGLAFASGLPVIGVSTLASVALAAADSVGAEGGQGDWLVALDARMQQVYSGVYRVSAGDQVTCLSADGLFDPEQVAVPDNVRACGDGQHYEALSGRLPVDHWLAGVAPRAGTVARLARHKWLSGDTMAARDAQPVYLRDKVIQGAVR